MATTELTERAPTAGIPGARWALTVALGVLILLSVSTGLSPARAADEDLAGDRLARATMLALPSTYRVDVTLRIPRIRTRSGLVLEVPRGDALSERGTATAVSPGGWLVSATHLVAPSARTMARIGYQQWQRAQGVTIGDAEARRWVEDSGAVAVGGRVLSLRVTQSEARGERHDPRHWTATVRRTATGADLSLLRIRAPEAPALALVDDLTAGTPVVSLGFGRADAWDDPSRPEGFPAVRHGRIERSGMLADPPRAATVVSMDVQHGDSGGPVVDDLGHLRGIVVLRGEGGGIMEQAGAVRALLAAQGIENDEGAVGSLYRRALARLWALDTADARTDLQRVRDLYPDHPAVEGQLARAADMSGAHYRLSGPARRRGVLLGVGILALLVATALALRLVWLSGGAEHRHPDGLRR
ncbi:MAG TPA: trypsin-like peptidase domain-containing protein [Miltoncostaeaceae bacterium]|nr:trypsin-like peptidase domain-containing protein [Miltoncostaeaceae bacterium]